MYYCYVHGNGVNGYLNFHAWLNEDHMRMLEYGGYKVDIIQMTDELGEMI